MTARKPLLELLVSMLTVRDVLVSCLGANARYLPHMTVPCPVFALCDSMSAAIPLGLGMALQRPDRHVVALEGDGSLLMRASEITVAVELGLPCIYVAWMDAALTQIGIKQRRAGLPQVGTTIPDYSCRKIADAFGAVGYDASSIDDLGSVLETVLAQTAPALIGVHVDQRRSPEWFELLRG